MINKYNYIDTEFMSEDDIKECISDIEADRQIDEYKQELSV